MANQSFALLFNTKTHIRGKKDSWRDKKYIYQPLMLSCGTKGLVHEVSQVIAYLSFDVT